jgi:hypothetical protein
MVTSPEDFRPPSGCRRIVPAVARTVRRPDAKTITMAIGLPGRAAQARRDGTGLRRHRAHPRPRSIPPTHPRSGIMAKGQQRSNKEAKKPKQDKSPAKPISPQAVKPAVTTVIPDRRKKP